MFGIRAALLISLVMNVLVNGYQDDGNLDGKLEVLLKRFQERLEDEERGYELQDLFERGFRGMNRFEVDPEVTKIYTDMSNSQTYKWVTFKIEGRKRVVYDKSATPIDGKDDEAQFNEMKNELTSEPRFILFNFDFKSTTSHRQISRVALIFWFGKSVDLIIYKFSKHYVTKALPNLGIELQASKTDELDYETFRVEVEKRYA